MLLAARLVAAFFDLCLVVVGTTLAILPIVFLILEFLTTKRSKHTLVRPSERPSRMILEGAPVLLLFGAVGIISGSLLNMNVESLILTPVLVALVPLIVGDAGIIGSVFGARLSSALHFGEIEAFKWSRSLQRNIVAVFVLGNASSVFIGFLVFAAFKVLGIPVPDLGTVLTLSFQVCFIVTVVMMAFTILIAFESSRRGLDPCNIVIPIMTSLGDVIGVFALVGIASIQGLI